jgi:arylsulfatase A-like enzyme
MAVQSAGAQTRRKQPNILVIMGDDIGMWNLSAYHRGMMGGRTPNIDRIAAEGALFTDYYAQHSCTAGRAPFITGQTPFRTGLLKVGLPFYRSHTCLPRSGGGSAEACIDALTFGPSVDTQSNAGGERK